MSPSAGGLFPYPAQASIQSATRHERKSTNFPQSPLPLKQSTNDTPTDVAVVTGLFLATYNIASAIGYTISGAIWSQVMPGELERRLAPVTGGNTTFATTVYGDPFTFATTYAIDSPERLAVIAAYSHVQRLLCITGICLTVPLIAFGLCTRNPRLGKEQSLPDAENFVGRKDGEAEVAREGL